VSVEFIAPAHAEFLSAVQFYEGQEPGLGRAFMADVEAIEHHRRKPVFWENRL
jgi:hypothetical protein